MILKKDLKETLLSIKPPFVFLETAVKDKSNKFSYLFFDFIDVIKFYPQDDVFKFFDKVQEFLEKGFWLVGYFNYEFGYYLEDSFLSFRKYTKEPLVWLGVSKKPIVLEDIKEPKITKNFKIKNIIPNIDFLQYKENIKKIKKYLEKGLTYQVNYTFKLKFKFIGDPVDLYLFLRKSQPTSYMAFINTLDNFIISLSPELFFRIEKNKIISKPMKGTIQKGINYDQEISLIKKVLSDKKIKAENIMIVDLLRNDIGRISSKVWTEKLLEVERYRTINQLTSTICGRLKKNLKFKDIFFSLFPCGSVTGAPKIETIKIIKSIEKEPRNIYTGAIGYINKKNACFNVAIRTIRLYKNKGELGVGGGIVYDSLPKDEYKEAILKAKFLSEDFSDFFIFESILYKNGSFFLLDLHLKRLFKSARYFSIPINIDNIKKELNSKFYRKTDNLKVKVLVDINGKIKIEKSKLDNIEEPVDVKISIYKTDPKNIFLYHKTSKRDLYDLELKKARKEGFFEVIFLNIYNELTEGSITNIFIKKDGIFYTPPISCGLLAGVLREKLIKEKKAKERLIKLTDLKGSDLYIGNSVKGLIKVKKIYCPF